VKSRRGGENQYGPYKKSRELWKGVQAHERQNSDCRDTRGVGLEAMRYSGR
jgi:hypothetical protein